MASGPFLFLLGGNMGFWSSLFASYLYRARYAVACLIQSVSSKIPSLVLHTAQSKPRLHLSQAWHELPQQEWSWSTWKVFPLLFGSNEPQIAHLPPCKRKVSSYHSGVTPYCRNLFLIDKSFTCFGWAFLHSLASAFNSSRRRKYQARCCSLRKYARSLARASSRCSFRHFFSHFALYALAHDRQCPHLPDLIFGFLSKFSMGCGMHANLQSFRQHIFIPLITGYNELAEGAVVTSQQCL